ncbi:hypothetical protein ABBQ32_005066 [Trebouxia sp. C0010 RCD-2024]
MTNYDTELAQLLAPSTFTVDECRARSRAARTPEELQLILLGEKRVMEAQAKRARAAASASREHPIWTTEEKAKIQRGKEAAERMRASADTRKNPRMSWARSSLASAESAGSWCFAKPASPNCIPVGAKKPRQQKLDLKLLKSINERYSMNSARSMASSIDASTPSSSHPATASFDQQG